LPFTIIGNQLRHFPFYPVTLLGLALVGWLDYSSGVEVTQSLLYGLICLGAGYRLNSKQATLMVLACLGVHQAASGIVLWQGPNKFQTVSEALLLVVVTVLGAILHHGEQSLERSRNRVAELHQQLRSHLEQARQIQLDLLGTAPSDLEGLDLAICYEVAVELGGDLFFVKKLPRGVFFYVGDVSGKGPKAAIAAACVRTLLEELVAEVTSPGQLLSLLQQRFVRLLPGDLFVTSFCALCQLQHNSLVYANAGHDPPLMRRAGASQLEELTGTSLPVGVDVKERFLDQQVFFGPGDRLLVYTDGLIDARLASGARLGIQVVEDKLKQFTGTSLELARQLVALAPEPRSDDVLVLAVAAL